MDGVLESLPVRGLATMGDRLSVRTLDRIIAVLNGDLVGAVRRR